MLAELIKKQDEQLNKILSSLAALQALIYTSEEKKSGRIFIVDKDLTLAVFYIKRHLQSSPARSAKVFLRWKELIRLTENTYINMIALSVKNPIISADVINHCKQLQKMAKPLKEIRHQISRNQA